MKRIKYACLEQTIQFLLRDEVPHDEAVQLAAEELQNYKLWLDKSHTKYKVIEELSQPDGSITIKIKKQYNSYDCGEYLD